MHRSVDPAGHEPGDEAPKARTSLVVLGVLLLLAVGGGLHLVGVLPPGG
jgi:hypothetical protein